MVLADERPASDRPQLGPAERARRREPRPPAEEGPAPGRVAGLLAWELLARVGLRRPGGGAGRRGERRAGLAAEFGDRVRGPRRGGEASSRPADGATLGRIGREPFRSTPARPTWTFLRAGAFCGCSSDPRLPPRLFASHCPGPDQDSQERGPSGHLSWSRSGWLSFETLPVSAVFESRGRCIMGREGGALAATDPPSALGVAWGSADPRNRHL